MPNDQRIIITGGSGFIGSFLIDRLIAEGYRNLVAINATRPCAQEEVENIIAPNSDKEKLLGILQKDDIVVHLACSSVPGVAERNRKEDIEKNLIWSVLLLEACVEKGIRKFVYLSSGGTVYGETRKGHSKETDATDPKNSYGALKLSIEKYLGVFGSLYGIPHTIVRLANPYGKKEADGKHRSVIDIFLGNILANEPLAINGDGTIVRDYIFIDDAIDFIFKTIVDGGVTGIYNLGSGNGTSLNEVIQTIETVMGYKAEVIHTPKKDMDIQKTVLDIDKARKTGWAPAHTLKEGVQKILSRASL